jgi:Ca2+-binding EF-hand superfamily protein
MPTSVSSPLPNSPDPVVRALSMERPARLSNAESEVSCQPQDGDVEKGSFKGIHRMSGLQRVPVREVKNFKALSVGSKLTEQQLLSAYMGMLMGQNMEVPPPSVQQALLSFIAFDEQGAVDLMDALTFISLLCEGTRDDKTNAIFRAVDPNGKGTISMAEMLRFLTTVYRIMLSPNASLGIKTEETALSAEDLATVFAEDCFTAAGVSHDGRVSVADIQRMLATGGVGL